MFSQIYYFDGKKIDICLQYELGSLIFPVFTCPSYNIITKFNDGDTDINSFSSKDLSKLLVEGMCLEDPNDLNSPVDPEKECEQKHKRAPFSQCKNNCPGGNFYFTFEPACFLFCFSLRIRIILKISFPQSDPALMEQLQHT